jgi:hypothetical protein
MSNILTNLLDLEAIVNVTSLEQDKLLIGQDNEPILSDAASNTVFTLKWK